MNQSLRLYIFSLIVLLAALPAAAVPAKPGLMTVRQADGSELLVRLVGDEHSHFYLSEDGYLLVNDNDTYYYGDVDASGNVVRSAYRATAVAERPAEARSFIAGVDMPRVFERLSARAVEAREAKARKAPRRGPGLFAETRFPSSGKQKAVVVLVEYTDKKMTVTNPNDFFTRMLNQTGFSDYGGTGSAAEFFKECSNGKFQPEFDVYGPVTLAHNMSYYGGNDWYGNDERPEEMVIEACQLLDSQIDFSQYDRDNDGYIDNVFVFYAGQGEANGGSSNTVWPHSWNIAAATSTPYYFDGVRLDRYACSNEWSIGNPDGVGTFIHEFSHVMGLPDLYATSYTSAFTPGTWSTMDAGPYNNDSRTPPLYSAFERYALDWIEPIELNTAMNVTLKSIGNNKCGIIRTSKTNEYFLVENRQQTSWDTYIPGHGMLVWHIDYNESVWASNTVNNSSSHQYVDIEEADGTQNEYSRDGDAFPGTANKTSFAKSTSPAMKTWSGTGLNYPITEIKEKNGVITFKVCGGLPDVVGVSVTGISDVTATTATAAWTADPNATSYLVTCFSKTIASGREQRIIAGDWLKKDVGNVTTVTIDGLQPLTEYFVEVCSTNGSDVSAASEAVGFTTLEPTFDLKAPVATEGSDITESSFVANWEALDGATEYFVDVFTYAVDGPGEVDVCDFTDGTKTLPEGWTATSQSSYQNAAYSGAAIPALRLTTDRTYIMSPTYTDDIYSVSFWHRGSNAPEGNNIQVMALVGNNYVEVATVPIVNAAGGQVTELTNLPEGARAVRLIYNALGKGSIAIDDIAVAHGRTIARHAVVEKASAGSALSMDVESVSPSTEYYYTVTASDGERLSQPSNAVKVVTLEGTVVGVTAVSAQAGITLRGHTIGVHAPVGVPVTVHDPQGRQLFAGRTGADGALSFTLRASGIVIVRAGASAKIFVIPD